MHGTTQLLSEVLAEPQFYSGAIACLTPEKQTMDMGKQSEGLEAKKLMESEFLTHYDLKKPIILSCDASPYGVGACLSRLGNTQPVAFASRTLSNTERKYAQIEEALALIFGVRKSTSVPRGKGI